MGTKRRLAVSLKLPAAVSRSVWNGHWHLSNAKGHFRSDLGSRESMNAGNERENSIGDKPPGLEVEYNHDLNVSERFVAAYPSLRKALKDEPLLQLFDSY